MGSNQNPIHRDRDKRRTGGQAFEDTKETMTQNQAQIDRHAPFPEDQSAHLTDEQREQMEKDAASQRLADVQKNMNDEKEG